MCTNSHDITSVQSHLQVDVEINYIYVAVLLRMYYNIILKGANLNAAINFTMREEITTPDNLLDCDK